MTPVCRLVDFLFRTIILYIQVKTSFEKIVNSRNGVAKSNENKVGMFMVFNHVMHVLTLLNEGYVAFKFAVFK